jgi:hypothetical protein
MNLFRKRGNPPKQADETPVPAAPAAISLSAEQKSLLETPIDPKLNRMILQRIYAYKAEAERVLNAERISDSPPDDSEERHVIRNEHGFWRIVPGSPPERGAQFLDSL